MIGEATRGRRPALVAWAILLGWSGMGAAADRASPPAVRLAVGYSAQIFIHVDAEEARSVTKVWAESILRRKFSEGTTESLILNGAESLGQAFLDKRIDFAVMISDEYVRLRDRVPLQPVFVSADDRGPYHQLVLLVRRDGNVRRLSELRSKRLTLSRDQSKTIHLTWLETLLMKEGVWKPEGFFSAIKEVKRPSEAILPVFFQQADACLTTRQAFDVACELNPQLGKELVVLVQSQDVAGGVLAFRTDYDPGARAKIGEVLATLQADAEGSQFLKLFRMKRLLPWRPEYVETVEALLREHESLHKGPGGRR